MNVLFHATAAIGISVLLFDTKQIEKNSAPTAVISITALLGFALGVICRGGLDYIPHCYPVNPKWDAIGGLAMILGLTWLTNRRYRLITGLSFLGSIFPDLVDLSPTILNKYLELNLPITNKLFPWHWQEFSGSIYSRHCGVSTFNHLILIFAIAVICWCRRTDVKTLFSKDSLQKQ